MQTICLKFCRNKKKKALEVKETPRRTFLESHFPDSSIALSAIIVPQQG